MDIFRNARQNLMRRQAEIDGDVERQQGQLSIDTNTQPQTTPAETTQTQTVRPSPVNSVLRRFADLPRPFARQSGPRPTSSRYDDGSEIASPKTPQFAVGTPMPMPSIAPSLRSHSRSHSRTHSRDRKSVV